MARIALPDAPRHHLLERYGQRFRGLILLALLAAACRPASVVRRAPEAASVVPPPAVAAAAWATAPRPGPSSTPTMSAEVARYAEQCPGLRTGPPVATATLVAAHFADGVWTVEMKGLWRFHSPSRPVPRGEATHEPWQDTEFVTDCVVRIDASSVLDIGPMSAWGLVTATPGR